MSLADLATTEIDFFWLNWRFFGSWIHGNPNSIWKICKKMFAEAYANRTQLDWLDSARGFPRKLWHFHQSLGCYIKFPFFSLSSSGPYHYISEYLSTTRLPWTTPSPYKKSCSLCTDQWQVLNFSLWNGRNLYIMIIH